MLEEVKRGGAPPVEQLDVALFCLEEIAGSELLNECHQSLTLACRHQRRVVDRISNLRQRLSKIVSRVGEQGAERPQHDHFYLLRCQRAAPASGDDVPSCRQTAWNAAARSRSRCRR